MNNLKSSLLLFGKCGIPAIPPARVIGGKDAVPGSWPWQVGLYSEGKFFCGGSLVAPEWVVTAAHCVDLTTKYDVVLGDYKRSSNDGTEQTIRVKNVIIHPKWSWRHTDPDIALLKLSRPPIPSKAIGLVCLPKQDEIVPPGSPCYITGWGKSRHPNKEGHDTLQQALLPSVSLNECQRKLAASNVTKAKHLTLNKNAICGGEIGSIKGGCYGDSGGPFVCKARDGSYVLQGVVSWGSDTCNALEMYSVFARVANFRSWIDNKMKNK